MGITDYVKSTQEQAVASWVNYLNQVRLDRLMEALTREQDNLGFALETIKETLTKISEDIIDNGMGRGGQLGIHGFIAEVAECGIENARAQIEGAVPICKWIDDNGPADLLRAGREIQLKFVNSGNHLSLQAVMKHMRQYPGFLKEGGIYQIPADHYEKIRWLLSISEEQANKMPTSTGEFSLKQWREVHELFDSGEIRLGDLEPSALKYGEVQKNAYEGTLEKEKQTLQKRNQERRDTAYQKSKPSFSEGAQATIVSAAVEAGTTFCIEVVKKLKGGKRLQDFDENDWKEIAENSGIGFVKGGIRGASLYALTNFTATPAAVANALITASFDIAEQAHLFRKGELDELSFIENSEILCLDAAVSALSSFAGQVLIPIPILGAVIGNAVGTMVYQIAKNNLGKKEQQLAEEHMQYLNQLNRELHEQYFVYFSELMCDLELFMRIIEKAFVPDMRIAFAGSIELARAMGVPSEEILDSQRKILAYFND